MTETIPSPLQYPGGKNWLFKHFIGHLPIGTKKIVSPFLGGGTIEWNLAARGIQVYAYDICPYLVNFWKHWVQKTSEVEDEAKLVLEDYSYETLSHIKMNFEYTGFFGAVLYYACNRVSFGSLTLQSSHVKHFEKIDGIFYYPLYQNQTVRRKLFPHSERWRDFPIVPLHVECLEFKTSLQKHPNIFAYLDPPYSETEDLYGLKTFDHIGLAGILWERPNWILSYSDRPLIRKLYEGYHTISMKGKNFKTGKKTSKELLIFSHDIACRLQTKPEQLRLL